MFIYVSINLEPKETVGKSKIHDNSSAHPLQESQITDQLGQSDDMQLNETNSSDPEVEQLMKLPDTVSQLTSKDGVKVFLVGTAHFSTESQEDVAKVQ